MGGAGRAASARTSVPRRHAASPRHSKTGHRSGSFGHALCYIIYRLKSAGVCVAPLAAHVTREQAARRENRTAARLASAPCASGHWSLVRGGAASNL